MFAALKILRIMNILKQFWTHNMQDITHRQTPFRFTTHEGKLYSIFSINSQVVMWRSVDGISRYNLLIQLKIHSFGAQRNLSFNDTMEIPLLAFTKFHFCCLNNEAIIFLLFAFVFAFHRQNGWTHASFPFFKRLLMNEDLRKCNLRISVFLMWTAPQKWYLIKQTRTAFGANECE